MDDPATSAEAALEPKGPEAARLRLRTAAYCVLCDRIVERSADGCCPEGHPPAALTGSIPLASDEVVPSLPRVNWGAFALPPVWGPAHGQWVGVLFLPIWLFTDSVASTASRGPVALVAAVLVLLLTVAFQFYFAKRANGVAWRRVADHVSVEEFIRRQRRWTVACVPVGVALLGWGLFYRFVLA
ncbi:MAG TPA: viscotoxin-A3 [Coriobacteriia bacterium]|nr:viscotoxin-A3 [Coriobacteriia bacterium]